MSANIGKQDVRIVEVSGDRDGQRLDNFLLARLKGVPRSVIYRLIRKGQVRVNGGRAKPFRKLRVGDRIRIPPVRLAPGRPVSVPPAVRNSLEAAIIFEDSDLLVVNKPPGMAVHGGSGINWGVIDVVRQMRPQAEVGLVHRLDRDTSGCLLLAKNVAALKHLHQQFRDRKALKRYFSLLNGRLSEDKMSVDAPLAKIERCGERHIVADPDGKPALTEFRRLEDYSGYSFVEALPISGRTHQIRAHAVFLGSPCVGDERYASPASLRHWRRFGLQRLFLHAHSLTVQNLVGEELQLSCPLPDELRQVLDSL